MLLVMPMAGCNKYDKEGAMDMPGVALTFDDNSIDNWYSYMPLLDSFGVKATFIYPHIINFPVIKKRNCMISSQEDMKLLFIQPIIMIWSVSWAV